MRELAGQSLKVLRMAADGLGVKETAREMGLTGNTVKKHRARLLDFLKANNMAHAVAEAYRRGVLS
jgi:DNA-binding CsgD family transcriptional regulator